MIGYLLGIVGMGLGVQALFTGNLAAGALLCGSALFCLTACAAADRMKEKQ